VLDEVESRALQEAALDDALDGTDHPLVVEMLSSLGVDRAREAARAVLDRGRSAGHARPRVPVPVPAVAEADVATLDRLTEQLRASRDVDSSRKLAAAVALAGAQTGRWAAITRLPMQVGAAAKAVCGPWNDAAAAIRTALRDRDAVPLLEAFAAFFERFAAAYEARKRDRGALDFEDLQLLALRVLETDERAQAAYRFARVYVDEAQDVNPLQDRLVQALGAPRELRVGDQLQAIYRFRWADVETFRRAGARMETFGLAENYRSQPEVLDALNGWFAGVFADPGAGADFTPLAGRADREPPADPPVELVLVEAADGKPSRDHEAAELVAVVERLRGQGFAQGDIAVLFRARTDIARYDDALRRAGIRTVLVGGTVFAEQEQVADVLALLRLVENPRDEPALVRALASPYWAASDAELAAIRIAAGEGRLWDALPGVPALAEMPAELNALRARRRELSLPGLVEAAIAFRDYALAALALEDGPRRYANLRRLVQLADRFGAVRGADLRGFLRFIEQATDLGADPGEPAVVDEELDAVRLLTIHGAKGQEFPAVIVADCANPGGGGAPAVVVSGDGTRVGFCAAFDGSEEKERCFDHTGLVAEEKRLREQEERRIYYVGLTRAKRSLTVMGLAPRKSDGRHSLRGGLGFLAPALGLDPLPAPGAWTDAPVGDGVVRVRSAVVPLPAVEAAARAVPAAVDEEGYRAPAPAPGPAFDARRGVRLSYSALAAGLGAVPATPDAPTATPAVATGATPGGARRFGERFHAAIERVDWRAPALALPADAGADERDRAERLFATIRDGALGQRLAGAAEVRTERPFALALDGVILEGVLDVWAREPDGTVLVVDWKTGTRHGADDPGYALQCELYALAVLRSGADVVETAWCFLEDGAVASERFGQADAEALAARVRAALAG
jgi:ATP-dependent exoDNAse (exonuclease V) beta subunit